MRRSEREITDKNEIYKVMKSCQVCNLALFDEEYPYIVPMNYGVSMEEGSFALYFHGANAGKKMALMEKNPHVAFTMSGKHELVTGEKACDYSMDFESVCGRGILTKVEDYQEKIEALNILMNQYSDALVHEFDERMVQAIAVLKITVTEITGKRLKEL